MASLDSTEMVLSKTNYLYSSGLNVLAKGPFSEGVLGGGYERISNLAKALDIPDWALSDVSYTTWRDRASGHVFEWLPNSNEEVNGELVSRGNKPTYHDCVGQDCPDGTKYYIVDEWFSVWPEHEESQYISYESVIKKLKQKQNLGGGWLYTNKTIHSTAVSIEAQQNTTTNSITTSMVGNFEFHKPWLLPKHAKDLEGHRVKYESVETQALNGTVIELWEQVSGQDDQVICSSEDKKKQMPCLTFLLEIGRTSLQNQGKIEFEVNEKPEETETIEQPKKND